MNHEEARALLATIKKSEPTMIADLVMYGTDDYGIHIKHRKARIDRYLTSADAWQALLNGVDDPAMTLLEWSA